MADGNLEIEIRGSGVICFLNRNLLHKLPRNKTAGRARTANAENSPTTSGDGEIQGFEKLDINIRSHTLHYPLIDTLKDTRSESFFCFQSIISMDPLLSYFPLPIVS
ncbi:hypothetical protein VTK73DRAFT_9335 [Phialemonium thermophilum]|uniref:Uncharacterized protein n=1 Tax=Phialemonium thermophilum TaxID=223376 RepID=A0ABR3XKB9_9PEZI